MTTAAHVSPTGRAEIDDGLVRLREAAIVWATLPVSRKIALLLACKNGVYNVARVWTTAAARAKGIEGTPLAGEESIGGPWAVLRALNAYVRTLQEIERFGAPSIEEKHARVRRGGQVVVDVFPGDLSDGILLNGVRAEVWMQSGVTPRTLRQTMGEWYQRPAHEPRVALVLGAGNIASIAPLDVLYKMIADGAVCALKLNPVNEYLGEIFNQAFAPLRDEHLLEIFYGGVDAGTYLCRHPLVDEIHVTGSDRTYDAIVFGDGPDAVERKRRNDPLLAKPITSELGNVSPTIVVPGEWSDADLRFQAENVVTQKLHNDGFNCVASQVLILPSGWGHTRAFIENVEQLMRSARDRPAYYPGAAARCDALCASHHDVERFGRNDAGFVPRTIVRVDPSDADEATFRSEAFASLLAVTTIPGEPETYLRDAVDFANDRLRGTLGANLIAHPRTMRRHADAFDRALEGLRYGCIGVNAWTGVGFLLCETPWGAYPGHTRDEIGSGTGVVHNSHLFSRSQKSVVYAPFAPFPRSLFGYGATLLPKPPWFVTNRNQARIGEALCDFEMAKSPAVLAKVAFLAMIG
jgi:aldehyde dehydrogenase (NAD(P)+)